MDCFICNSEAKERLKKGSVVYYECSNCKTLFSSELRQLKHGGWDLSLKGM